MPAVELDAVTARRYCLLNTSVTGMAMSITASGPLLLSTAGGNSCCWRSSATQVPQQHPEQFCIATHKNGPPPSCSSTMAASTVSVFLETPIKVPLLVKIAQICCACMLPLLLLHLVLPAVWQCSHSGDHTPLLHLGWTDFGAAASSSYEASHITPCWLAAASACLCCCCSENPEAHCSQVHTYRHVQSG